VVVLHRRGLPGGEGVPRAGAVVPGGLSHPEVPGERRPAPLLLLVPRGRTAHLWQRRPTQERYVRTHTHVETGFCFGGAERKEKR